jgi:hypothetical protein
VEQLTQQLKESRSKQQELAAQVAKLQSLVEKVVESTDSNTMAFRDVLQMVDAKTCVHEAVISDLVGDLGVGLPVLTDDTVYLFKTKRLPDGRLDADAYFKEWRRRLIQEEAKQADPYEGAVVFGGDFDAKVNEPTS